MALDRTLSTRPKNSTVEHLFDKSKLPEIHSLCGKKIQQYQGTLYESWCICKKCLSKIHQDEMDQSSNEDGFLNL